MILTLGSSLRTVFTIYAVFWVSAVVILYFAVGALTRRAERAAGKDEHAGSAQGH
jgi:hypothetical protein